jgi:hypothetical protein
MNWDEGCGTRAETKWEGEAPAEPNLLANLEMDKSAGQGKLGLPEGLPF